MASKDFMNKQRHSDTRSPNYMESTNQSTRNLWLKWTTKNMTKISNIRTRNLSSRLFWLKIKFWSVCQRLEHILTGNSQSTFLGLILCWRKKSSHRSRDASHSSKKCRVGLIPWFSPFSLRVQQHWMAWAYHPNHQIFMQTDCFRMWTRYPKKEEKAHIFRECTWNLCSLRKMRPPHLETFACLNFWALKWPN